MWRWLIIFVCFGASMNSSVAGRDGSHKSAHNTTHGGRQHPPIKINTTANPDDTGVFTTTLESNIYQGSTYLTPSANYSNTNGWDFSLSSNNIPVYGGGAQNFEYDTYVGISKSFNLTDDTILTLGSQNGTTLFSNTRHLHHMDYFNIRQEITSFLSIYVGSYYANSQLTTTVNQLGVNTGIELSILPNKLTLTGDYISGHQNISGAVVKMNWNVLPTLQLYTGVGVPETKSGNEFYGIVGISVPFK